jgi:hypothetical protein
MIVTSIMLALFTSTSVLSGVRSQAVNNSSSAKVGVYYYVWYKPGLGNAHWNTTTDKVVDTPVQGYYDSGSEDLIKWQLNRMIETGIDFVMLSWWGDKGDDSYIDTNARLVESIITNDSLPIKMAILVEPFNHTSGSYDFPYIYNYIYNAFAEKDAYLKVNGKPLIGFYNDPNMTRNGAILRDPRFEARIIGHEDYTDWVYWSFDAPNAPQPWTNRTQPVCKNEEIDVCPRYDDYWQRPSNYFRFDINYSENLYDAQWSNAIASTIEKNIDIIMITSWNEYHERTQIEPCNDSTSINANDTSFLLEKTKKYIATLKGTFSGFVKELCENVPDLNENRCRFDAKDSFGYGMDTIKIIENPEGGYFGLYHFRVGGNSSEYFQVRLANSTDLLNWTFVRTIEFPASMPTITQAPNRAYIVAFEKHVFGATEERHVGFYYFPNLTSLLTNSSAYKFIAPLTLASRFEGTPNIYNVTIDNSVMNACVGFHYNDAQGLDNIAVGYLTIPLDNPKNMTWSNTEAQTEYNRQLREDWKVEGNIGDRDYGQIFGRNFTLQEVQYVKGNDSTWAIFLYDHLTGNFTKLNIKTPKGSTSFSNPTFTLLKSPDGSDSIVVTYFLHTGGAQPGEAGELIFYMEFKTIHFEVTYRDSLYSVDVTSNSTIPQQSFNLSGYERSISFNVSGPDGSEGYCIINLTISLAQDLWPHNYTVLIDGKQHPFENWNDSTNTYFFVLYSHSERNVTIIPEFTSLLILPLFMTVALLAIVTHKEKLVTKACT